MRTLVIGDLHLYASAFRKPDHHAARKLSAASRDLARLAASYAARGPIEIVLSGDVYDLAATGSSPVEQRLAKIAAHHEELHEALRDVCRRGGRVVFIPGNHDYELLNEAAQRWVETHIPGARVQPWFYRVRDVAHIEHGNQHDPDNAHPHPLLPDGDPLGILLTRQLLHRLGDLRLLELNDRTPVPMLLHCFWNYGLRTPGMVLRYVLVGLAATRRARLPDAAQRAEASARLDRFVKDAGLDRAAVQQLVDTSPRPTHTDGDVLFRRMYLDRTLLGAATLFATLAALLLGAPRVALGIFGVAAAIGAIFGMYKNVYRGRVQDLLQAKAHSLAGEAAVRHVVFGHAHKEYDDGAYLNPGSFAFPPKKGLRTFVEIDGDDARLMHMHAGEGVVDLAPRIVAFNNVAFNNVAFDSAPRAKSADHDVAAKKVG